MSRDRKRLVPWCLLVVALSTSFFAGSARGGAQGAGAVSLAPLVPGDSQKGLGVFLGKRCNTCHSLPGEPQKAGPAMHGREGAPFTAGEIAAGLWNHAPVMWRKMKETRFEYSQVSRGEMSNLFAFLYYAGLLDPVGDAERGRVLFDALNCATCHATGAGEAEKAGPGVPYWTAHTTPIRLAQAMWNHAGEMEKQIRKDTISWPELKESDLPDILAYVWKVNTIAQKRSFTLGDPNHGRELFRGRGCARCHAVATTEGEVGPSLQEMNGAARTLSGMAGLMWNHYPEMKALFGRDESQKVLWMQDEMADLIAYLFSVGYFDEDGSALRGKDAFISHRCSECHTGRNPEAPLLAKLKGRVSAVSIALALWNHGPAMLERMQSKGIDWPVLDREEVVNLMAYLGSGSQ